MGKELEIGKCYTWEQVKSAYPDRWVRMHNCKFGPGQCIIEGILVGVYSDDEVEPVQIMVRHDGSHDVVDRTSCGLGIGIIECLNAEVGVRDEA